jgi:hypothetical protein
MTVILYQDTYTYYFEVFQQLHCYTRATSQLQEAEGFILASDC